MYPYKLFWGIDLYNVFLCIAVVSAIVVFRVFADKNKIYWKVQNLAVISAFLAIIGGYASAVFFQALYNIKENNGFVINSSTGATFYGGLIGGAAVFLLIYFTAGYFLLRPDKEHIYEFWHIADIAAASISAAHAFGRLGCLMAGCCHGAITDEWYGIYMHGLGAKAVPLQLYESLFLFALFGFFVFRLVKKKGCNLSFYMGLYGAWRFVIEYFRDDDRGSTLVDFLSPSQLIAIIMIIGAVALYFIQKKNAEHLKKKFVNKLSEEINE